MAMVAGLLEGNVSFLEKEREKNFFFRVTITLNKLPYPRLPD